MELNQIGTGGRYIGLCPFHEGKKPSFIVESDKQFFHCFGCGAHGDVYTFLMKYRNILFKEALSIFFDSQEEGKIETLVEYSQCDILGLNHGGAVDHSQRGERLGLAPGSDRSGTERCHGGIFMFGIGGGIIGPIITALFVTAWEIYGQAFQNVLPDTGFVLRKIREQAELEGGDGD